jgi:hypothetical protein
MSSMKIALALAATLASACALNVGYLLEHAAVRRLPPLSVRTPLASLRLLLGSRRWLLGFGAEATGWMLFVVALSLAPLSLVQATAAGGIGILALLVARVTGVPLSRSERFGVGIAVGGLGLLGVSLAGGHGEGTGASYLSVGLWVAASMLTAFVAVKLLARRIGGGPAYGLATGLLFASGDVATKGAVEEGGHLGFVAALVGSYALGTIVLQTGFQHGSPLATAGIATLLTNALPIVAGMTMFSEPLPSGWLGPVRIAAFAAVVVGAVFLGERRHGQRLDEIDSPTRTTGSPPETEQQPDAGERRPVEGARADLARFQHESPQP